MIRRLQRAADVLVAVLVMSAFPASAARYAFSVYTPEDGLAATAVFRMEQDEKGYLWLATSEGVSRFDGHEFMNFDVSTGLPDQRVYSMVKDREGRFWFGHSDGVSLFDGRTLRNFSPEDGVAKGLAWAATLDRFGHPWFGTQNGGVSVWTGERFRSYGVQDGLPEEFVYGLFADSKDRLWIGTRYQGLAVARIDAGGVLEVIRTYPLSLLGAKGVRDIREDRDGAIYVATRGNGVLRFDGDTLEPAGRFLEGEDVYTMLVTSANELVVGMTLEGISIFVLPGLERRVDVDLRHGLASEIFSLFEDRDGGLWIATSAGVYRWPGEAIMNYGVEDGIPGTFVLGVGTDVDGSIWVSSAQGAARLMGSPSLPGGFEIRSLTRRDGLPSGEVWQVLRDSRGRLWVATADGLCLYTEGRGCRVWTSDDGLPTSYVSVLLESRSGDLWVGAAGGIVRLEIGDDGSVGAMVPLEGHPSIRAANVYALVESDGGALWIATDSGLFHLEDGTMSAFGPRSGLPRRGINDILLDVNGDLWVATSGKGVAWAAAGDVRGAATSFATFGTGHGLPSNTVMSLVDGGDGTIWAGTGAGVAQVDAKRVRVGSPLVVRRQLTSASGLLGSEPGSGGAFARAPDGTFWFGLARGVSRYDPALDRGTDVPPTVEVGRVVVDGRTVRVAPFDAMSLEADPLLARDEVILNHRARDIVFHYRGLSFHDPTRVTYQVQLEGFEDRWSEPTRARHKEYTHLPPGDYTFFVRAVSAAGLVSEEAASYRVTIRPPFWQTDWFPPIVLIALAMLVAAIVQLRSYAMKRHNAELAELVHARTADLEIRKHELELANARALEDERSKSRFLAGMSHELRTPLNSIIGFTELMLAREEGRESREEKFLGNVHHSAHQLLALINDLLDLSKMEAGKMEVFVDPVALPPLLETVLSTLEPLSTPRRIDVVREVPDNFPVVKLDSAKVRQILYNLLTNAIRFSPPGSSVRVAIRPLARGESPLDSDALVIEIEDCGIAIPQDEIQSIFEEYRQSPTVASLGLGTGLGLAIVRRFAELQGGIVQVEPNERGGSTFRVWLPQNAVEYETDSGPHRVLG